MIKVDENDPIGELEASFPYRDVQIKKGEDVKKYYDLEGELGRGKFGTVFKCREKGSKLTLAAKFIPIERRQDRKNVEREVEIMRTLQHPRLIQLYDAFQSNNIMCVVLELIEGGELFERVIDDDFILTEKACTIFMRQICEGVEFIHRKNILHLDLKPENILCLTKTGNRIKIIDFGLARKYEPDKKLQVLFGTPEFVAPEVVNFDQISYATDMWSVGVICYVLLSGLSPFMGETDIQTMSNVTLALYDYEDEAFDDISADAKDFIAKLLVKNQAYRMTASQCLAHPWLQRKTPIKQVQCLEPTKENLRTYVENFTPHSGINFKNKTEDSTKMDKIQQIIESDKRNINPTILRSFRKDSLTNNDKEIISNDYIKHSIRPQIKIPCNDNLIENRNTLNDNNYTNEIYNEKPVRYKMTLTPLVKNMLPNNLLPLQDNNSACIFNSQIIPQKMVEDINGLELKETDKTNIKSMGNVPDNQAIINQKLTDKSKLMYERSLNEPIKSLSNLATISSADINSTQLRSNSIIDNIDNGVKHRIIIPTIFGDNRTIKLINNKEFETTPFTFNMDSNKVVDITKDSNNDMKWPEVLVKIMEKNDRFGKEFISNVVNNKTTHNNVASISGNNSLINNTAINYDRKIDTQDTLSSNTFHCEHFLRFSPIVKGNETVSHTDIFNTIKSHGAGSINNECARLAALSPTIGGTNEKWKIEENSLQQNPFINNTHRQLIDAKTNMEHSISFQSDANTQKDMFLKPKLKSTPPWFSEMQEKPKEKEIINVRRKFKFTSTHRDVPLDAPIKFDIERFIYSPNNSSNCKEVNVQRKTSNILGEVSFKQTNHPVNTDKKEHK